MKKIQFAFCLVFTISFLSIHSQTMVVDTFYYTGSTQTFVIPQCASNLSVMIHGAKGGSDPGVMGSPGNPGRSGGYAGGDGGRIYVVISPTVGAILHVNVGGGGQLFYGGWNGGGYGGAGIKSTGGGGGGASDIRIGGNALSNRVFVAGGGGGGGGGSGFGSLSTGLNSNSSSNYGGGGGGLACSGPSNTSVSSCPSLLGCSGESGNPPILTACNGLTLTNGWLNGGGGGMVSAGGAPTYTGGCSGTSGSLFQGGAGGDSTCTNIYTDKGRFGGGGGGGGYYGGGGGYSRSIMAYQLMNDNGGGGGGSTYLNASYVLTYSLYGWAGIASSTFSNTVDGVVTFSYYINGPVVNASASQNYICSGQSVSLSANGVNNYTWLPTGNFAGSNNSVVNVSPVTSTQYTVQGFSSSTGCTSQTIVSVNVMGTSPTLTLSPAIPTVCLGSSVTISATGAGSYTWNTGQNGAGISVSPTVSTIYTVIGSASGTNQACMATKSLQVYVYNSPTVTTTASSTFICAGEQVSLTASGALTYTWISAANVPQINYGNLVVSPQNNTTYTVTGALANSCKATGVINVQVDACTGLSKNNNNPVKVYPNPNNGRFYVYTPFQTKLSVYTSIGILLETIDFNAGEKKEMSINKAGVYLLYYKCESSEGSIKLIVTD